MATLAAEGAPPPEVFAAVASGMADILDVPAISMIRFDLEGLATKVAGWGKSPFPVGTRWTLEGQSVMADVARTGRRARIDDYALVPGEQASRLTESGIRSAIGVPITVDGMTWGAVIAFAGAPHDLSADAGDRLARFTELVATAVANSQARDDLRQLADEQAALRRVATLIASEVRPADVFAAVAKEVALTLDVPLSSVIRFEADGTAAQVGTWGEGNPFPIGTSWSLDEHSVTGRVARTRASARVDDYAAIPGDLASRVAREAGIHSAVGVPILVNGSPWGAMMVLSTAERPLREGIESRLGAFTELIATAIANTQARDDLRRLAEEQAALRRVAVLVARDADPADVFDAVAREVSHIMGGAKIAVYRFDPNRVATDVGAWGEHAFTPGRQWTLDGPSVTASVLDSGRPARIDDYSGLSGSIAEFARSVGLTSTVGAPIVVDGNIWGGISVISEGAPLPAETEARLAGFSELVGTAISKTEARDALRRSEELYRRAIAEAGAVPYALDYATGTYSFIGDGIEELTGYRPDELDHDGFGRLVLETFLHGEQAPLDPADAAHRTRSGEFERWRSDLRIRARDGSIRWVSDASVEILGDTGLSVGSLGMLQDITERMRTDEERLRLAAILEATVDVVTLTDPEGRILYVNQAGRRLLGLGANEELSGATRSDFHPPAAAAKVVEEGIPTATRDGAWSGESALLARDGREIPVSEVILAHKDAHGDLTFFSGIARDLTERLELEDSLRHTQDEQAALRRVATLVAEGATPNDVFAAVAAEVARLLDVPAISMVRFEPDETSTAIAVWGEENPFGVGATFEPWPGVMYTVRQTGRPARLEDFAYSTGPTTARLQAARIHSGVGVPITVDGRVWGTIIALGTRGDSLPGEIADRLSRFTELVATAISNTQARDDLRRLADVQAALGRVATLVAEGASAPEVFAAVAREVAQVSRLPLVEVDRFDADGWLTVVGSAGNHPFQLGTRWEMLANPIGPAAIRETRGARRLEFTDDMPGALAEAVRSIGVRWAVGVPIVVDGQNWGSIFAAAADGAALPADAESRLDGFSELVSTAISNAQARDELDIFVREQAALRRVATITAAGVRPQAVFDAVVEEVKELLDLPVVALTRYEPDGMVLMIAAAGPHPFEKGTRWPLEGLPVASMVLESGEPAYLEEYVTDDPTTGPAIESAKVRSGLAVPIVVDNEVWGTISTASTDVPLRPDTEKRLVGFTELVATAVLNAQARDELSDLADEQAALRRVATLVAEGAGSPAVYDAICRETGPVIGATSVNLCQFTADRFNLTMGGWSVHDTHIPTGTRLPVEGGTINELVYESGGPTRIESYVDAQGALADLIRERGIRSEVAAPVVVDGRLWGCIIAGWDTDGAPPAGAERRLAGFAELVGTAVSNALTRSELVSSRARIVAAGDEARRRIERNLHDGVQQQLVSLQLELKTVDAGVPEEFRQTHDDIERVQGIVDVVLDDVREIAQGVHPATLSQWGLEPAIRTLARRSPIPVELELQVPGRLPQSVEIAVYYVLSEALANVVKHARATHAAVTASLRDDWLHATIRDDGVGGADSSRGSGIAGLVDRVEALGGRLSLTSAPRQGTTVAVALPLGGGSADGL